MARPEPARPRPRQPQPRRQAPAPKRETPKAKKADVSCAKALQTVSRACLAAIKRHNPATRGGDAEALHNMRIALTRLRTALAFFAPVIDTAETARLKREAAWLNGKLGAARDLDVSLQREATRDASTARMDRWKAERERRYVQLRRTLRGQRYRQFIDALDAWTGKRPAQAATDQTAASFSTDRLSAWQTKLRDKGHRLDRLGSRKRHKLRIRTKRFRYALEWSLQPSPPKQARARKNMLAQAKTIQEALGKLNDASEHRALAKARRLKPLPTMDRLEKPKIRRRLLKTATQALKELSRTRLR
jgi:CHAD domain-containing protein